MTSVVTALLVFACVFSGACAGLFLRTRLPQQHLTEGAKDAIRLSMGLIATLTALVLGLVTASAKSTYDAQDDAIRHTAAKVLLLDRMLANFGPDTREAREMLRRVVQERVDAIWPEQTGLAAARVAAYGEGAIFLILEMTHPLEGVMKLSAAPLRYALTLLGR